MRSPRHPMAAHRESGGVLAAAGPASSEAAAPDSGTAAPLGPPEDRRVRRRDLLNLLNYVNFLEGSIFVSFRHPESGEVASYQATPLPCADENLSCRWLVPLFRPEALAGYECDGLLLSDGASHVTVDAELVGLDAEGASFRLPESGRERRIRSIDRFACEGIEARIVQSGISLGGRLLDFNAESFRIEAKGPSTEAMRCLNPAYPVTALLSKGGELLYSGECGMRRMGPGGTGYELVLAPSPGGHRAVSPQEAQMRASVHTSGARRPLRPPVHGPKDRPPGEGRLGRRAARRGIPGSFDAPARPYHTGAVDRLRRRRRHRLPRAGALSQYRSEARGEGSSKRRDRFPRYRPPGPSGALLAAAPFDQ